MPRIRFIADPKLPRDWAHLGYRKGDEVALSADLCERWIRRGVAVYVAERPAPKPVEPPPARSPRSGPGARRLTAEPPAADTMPSDALPADTMRAADTLPAAP